MRMRYGSDAAAYASQRCVNRTRPFSGNRMVRLSPKFMSRRRPLYWLTKRDDLYASRQADGAALPVEHRKGYEATTVALCRSLCVRAPSLGYAAASGRRQRGVLEHVRGTGTGLLRGLDRARPRRHSI